MSISSFRSAAIRVETSGIGTTSTFAAAGAPPQ